MTRLSSWQRFIPVVLLLLATAFALEARHSNEVLPPHKDLLDLPIQLLGWQGRDIPLSPDTLEVLGPGNFLSRDYQRSPIEAPINLFIAFFPSQRTGDTIHSPKNCLPGSGWASLEAGHVQLRLGDGPSLWVNRYLIAKGTSKAIVLYWYQAHGRVTPSEYWAKIFLVTDAIRLNRTDGALVRVVTPIGDRENIAPAEARAIGFAEGLVPFLDEYIPR
jgi:EpsI family protein